MKCDAGKPYQIKVGMMLETLGREGYRGASNLDNLATVHPRRTSILAAANFAIPFFRVVINHKQL